MALHLIEACAKPAFKRGELGGNLGILCHAPIQQKDSIALSLDWSAGSNYYVRILSTLNRELLKPSSSVALHRHSNALVDILPPEADSSISLLSDAEKPNVSYSVSLYT